MHFVHLLIFIFCFDQTMGNVDEGSNEISRLSNTSSLSSPESNLLQPRYLDLSNVNLTRFLLSVASTPDSFGNSLVNGMYISAFRLAGYFMFGLIHSLLSETAEPGSHLRGLLDVFSFYFEPDSFATRLMQPFSLLFALGVGRLAYLLIVFGPLETFRGLFSTSGVEAIRRMYTFEVLVGNIFRFVFIEGIAVTTGMLINMLIGSVFLRDQDRRRRRRRDLLSNSKTENIEKVIREDFQRILNNLNRYYDQDLIFYNSQS